jgi:hypothetical protein
MQVDGDSPEVSLTLSRAELERLSAVLVESTSMLSQAEFYIRTGCSAPNILWIVRQLDLVAARKSRGFDIPILQGVESEENPSRPR